MVSRFTEPVQGWWLALDEYYYELHLEEEQDWILEEPAGLWVAGCSLLRAARGAAG